MASEFTKAQPEYVTVSLSDYSILKVTGPDTDTFLQGQLTCDLKQITEGTWQYGAHSDQKGKTLSTFWLVRVSDGVLIIASKPAMEASMAQLQKFGVFSKIELNELSEQFRCYGVFGTAAPARMAERLGQPLANGYHAVTETEHDFVLQVGTEPEQYLWLSTQESSPTSHSEDAWWALEIERGRPTLFSGTIAEYVPQMLNVQALDGISFTKGCYIGQETIARMKYLGKQKRSLFRLHGQVNAAVAPGATVEQQLGENWRRAGTVINAVSRTQGQLDALAVLPSDLEANTKLRIKGDDASLLEIYPLPYKLDES